MISPLLFSFQQPLRILSPIKIPLTNPYVLAGLFLSLTLHWNFFDFENYFPSLWCGPVVVDLLGVAIFVVDATMDFSSDQTASVYKGFSVLYSRMQFKRSTKGFLSEKNNSIDIPSVFFLSFNRILIMKISFNYRLRGEKERKQSSPSADRVCLYYIYTDIFLCINFRNLKQTSTIFDLF